MAWYEFTKATFEVASSDKNLMDKLKSRVLNLDSQSIKLKNYQAVWNGSTITSYITKAFLERTVKLIDVNYDALTEKVVVNIIINLPHNEVMSYIKTNRLKIDIALHEDNIIAIPLITTFNVNFNTFDSTLVFYEQYIDKFIDVIKGKRVKRTTGWSSYIPYGGWKCRI